MQPAARTVRLGDTPCGRGVFSLLPFAIREVIGVIRGTVIDDPDYESDYCMALDDRACLEPSAPFCYLNHHCDPNCEWYRSYAGAEDCLDGGPNSDARVLLRAIKPIRPGDELTIDYNWPADMAIRCRCQSANCRGWVVAANELADVLRP